ncbi:MAG: hypothetical protein QXH20_06915 [Candidatus Bathyarchaeia archaeon]
MSLVEMHATAQEEDKSYVLVQAVNRRETREIGPIDVPSIIVVIVFPTKSDIF